MGRVARWVVGAGVALLAVAAVLALTDDPADTPSSPSTTTMAVNLAEVDPTAPITGSTASVPPAPMGACALITRTAPDGTVTVDLVVRATGEVLASAPQADALDPAAFPQCAG